MPKRLPSRDILMDERRKQLGLSWDEVAQAAGVSKNTLLSIRRGGDSYPKTIRNVEAALQWALGSIAAIDEAREPTPVDPRAVVAGQPPAFRAPGYTPITAADADDPAIQLRQIRQRLGATAFWAVIEQMRDEDATLRGSASAS
ncbi:helix-turn-helix domain-containing protein [Actinophytocola sp. NPDC049390]|uniref:helix-turn-helix domain-containing protein n=1 Tax=Actinophytocola sp. NPDC049390 TaxID=3363894 RepID=UPI003797DE08